MSNLLVDGNVDKMYILTVTLDPASVGANTTAAQSVTVRGVKVGDVILPMKPSLNAGLGVAGARVSAADTISITMINASGGAVDASSESWVFLVIRPKAGYTLAAIP